MIDIEKNIEEYEKYISKLLFKKDELKKSNEKLQENLKNYLREDEILTKFQKLITFYVKEIQNNLKIEIENLINSFLKVAFSEKSYQFCFDFVERRNKTEVDFFIKDENNKIFNPLEENGGGLVDLLAFALRIAFLTIIDCRKILIFDEPLKFLDKDRKKKVAGLLKKLSEDLKIQFIVVTHDIEFIESSDNIIEIK